MDGFFFAYTLAVLAVCLVSTVLQAMAWSVKRSRAFVAAGWFFSAYFVELGVIFLDEHLHQNVAFPAEAYYAVTYPVARVAIACVLWGSLWAWVLTAVDAYSRRRLLVPVALFAAAQVACLALLPYGALRQFLFYTCRQVFCIGMGLFAWHAWRAAPTDEQRAWIGRHRRLLLFFMAGVALTVAEDATVILAMEPAKAGGLPLYLSERNFCENVLMVVLAAALDRIAWREISFRLAATPAAPPAPAPAAPAATAPAAEPVAAAAPATAVPPASGDTFSDHVDELMPRFASAHGLTAREREVLGLVLAGRTNQQMADTLVVSVGTVKTHVHNIVRKCDAENRADLKELFWSE
ncbi:helix-turn-helix transcriptional regulator [Caniella muris]|uniref:helix-turn-helix transcriptional regulator n=1 Tax=Caniella muris TaxID=2941502 RepID=UPI002041659D|nr:helix-turn-helix transcriptional regulator [Caniella muris]